MQPVQRIKECQWFAPLCCFMTRPCDLQKKADTAGVDYEKIAQPAGIQDAKPSQADAAAGDTCCCSTSGHAGLLLSKAWWSLPSAWRIYSGLDPSLHIL